MIKRLWSLQISVFVVFTFMFSGWSYGGIKENHFRNLLQEHRQARTEKSYFEMDRIPPRVKVGYLESGYVNIHRRNLYRAEVLATSGKFVDAKKLLRSVDSEQLITSDYKSYLELEFKVYLGLRDIRKVSRILVRLTKHTKYLSFLDEGDTFLKIKELFGNRKRVFFPFLLKSLANFPYTDASLEAFNHLISCDFKGKIPYRVIRRLTYAQDTVPGLKDWIMALLEQNLIDFGPSGSRSRYRKVYLMSRLGKHDKALEYINNVFDNTRGVTGNERLLTLQSRIYTAKGWRARSLASYAAPLQKARSKTSKKKIQRAYIGTLLAENIHANAANEIERYLRSYGNRYLRWKKFWSFYSGGDLERANSLISRRMVPPLDRKYPEMTKYWKLKILRKLESEQRTGAIEEKLIKRYATSFYTILYLNEFLDRSPDLRRLSSLKLLQPVSWNYSNDLFDVRAWYGIRQGQIKKIVRRQPLDKLYHDQRSDGEKWKVEYPRPYLKWIEDVLEPSDVDPNLLYSVMRAESFYNSHAKSPVGAIGLSQIMPYTALYISQDLGDDDFRIKDLEDPKINILFASYYLDKLLEHYSGNILLAVAAYNAGPIKVNEWIAKCAQCKAGELVESITFKETRQYVKKVIEIYGQYSRIYEHKPIPRLKLTMPLVLGDRGLY